MAALFACERERALLGGDAANRWRFDFTEAFGEAFALRIDERRGARARDRVDGLAKRNLPLERRADHVGRDQAIIRGCALQRVAIALDETGAQRDFERKLGR